MLKPFGADAGIAANNRRAIERKSVKAIVPAVPFKPTPVSPLMLADRLLTLAQDADRAGYAGTAAHLVTVMYEVLDGRKPAWH